ncbi:MAG: L-rhamnose mutarotase [Clostridiales bacterium]|nr:L-rhamnose mutarotase [Clostridiales bacterium]
MKRYGQVIKIKPEKIEIYKKLHANIWPKVGEMIALCNMKNYSIFLRDGYLFAYFEYHGTDFDADMTKMAADKTTQEWWNECDPCQTPVDYAEPGEWWVNMEEVFHLE